MNKATAVYAAKRNLVDRLDIASKVVGGPLHEVQVDYAREGDLRDRAIFLGNARWSNLPADAEGALQRQRIVVFLYVRLMSMQPAREAEQAAEVLADAVVEVLDADPELTGELSYTGVNGGTADLYAGDGPGTEVILSLQLLIDAWVGVFDG